MSIIRFAFWILLAPLLLGVGCATPKSAPDQIDQLLTRTSQLEQRVRALEQSNEELQQEVRELQRRREPKEPLRPQEPRWSYPQTNEVPHLTPLEVK